MTRKKQQDVSQALEKAREELQLLSELKESGLEILVSGRGTRRRVTTPDYSAATSYQLKETEAGYQKEGSAYIQFTTSLPVSAGEITIFCGSPKQIYTIRRRSYTTRSSDSWSPGYITYVVETEYDLSTRQFIGRCKREGIQTKLLGQLRETLTELRDRHPAGKEEWQKVLEPPRDFY